MIALADYIPIQTTVNFVDERKRTSPLATFNPDNTYNIGVGEVTLNSYTMISMVSIHNNRTTILNKSMEIIEDESIVPLHVRKKFKIKVKFSDIKKYVPNIIIDF